MSDSPPVCISLGSDSMRNTQRLVWSMLNVHFFFQDRRTCTSAGTFFLFPTERIFPAYLSHRPNLYVDRFYFTRAVGRRPSKIEQDEKGLEIKSARAMQILHIAISKHKPRD